MGLLDIFGKKGPSEEAILKQVRRAKEGYAQPDYRRMAMDQLLKWDTDESLRGILERFSVVVQSPHWDEDEKCWLVGQLVQRGERMLPILRRFILENNEVNYALQTFRQIVKDDDAYAALLIEALKTRPPSDHRSVQGKQEILAAMMELPSHDFDSLIAPHLDDHSDDVKCLAIQALSKSNKDEIKERIVAMLSDDSHSARVLRTAASVVQAQKFKVNDTLVLSEAVSEDFRIENGLLVRL